MKKMLTAGLLLIGLAAFATTTYAVTKEKESVFKTELSISKMSIEANYSMVIVPTYAHELNGLVPMVQFDIVVQDLKQFDFNGHLNHYRWQVSNRNYKENIPSLKFLSCNTLKVPPKLRC